MIATIMQRWYAFGAVFAMGAALALPSLANATVNINGLAFHGTVDNPAVVVSGTGFGAPPKITIHPDRARKGAPVGSSKTHSTFRWLVPVVGRWSGRRKRSWRLCGNRD